MTPQPALATPQGVIHRQSAPHPISRFVNVAASLLVVAAIAFAGWFSVMNLRPGGDMDPRYASVMVKQETAGNGVCDVEPLTVDQAVRIVQSPLAYVFGSAEAVEKAGMYLTENFLDIQPWGWDTLMSLASYISLPITDDEYFSLLAFSNEYADCIMTGTKGQLWAMMDPIVVQREIIVRIPLLQPMDVTEAAIAELLAIPNVNSNENTVRTMTWQPNADREHMARVDYGLTRSSNSSYIVPFQILNADGVIIGSYDIFGNSLLEDRASEADPGNIVLIRSKDEKSWYIVGGFESSKYADMQGN